MVFYRVEGDRSGAKGYVQRLSYLRKVDTPTAEQSVLPISRNGQGNFSIDKPFKLAVWNIYKGYVNGSKVFQEIQQYDPDVALLQEYPHGAIPAYDFLNNKDSTMGIFFFARRDNKFPVGTLTVSKAKIQSEKALVSEFKERTGTVKTVLFTSYDIDGSDEKLGIINFHGMKAGGHKFEELLGMLDLQIEDHKGPLIVAGDFNTFTARRYSKINEVMKKYGLEEVSLPEASTGKSVLLAHIRTRLKMQPNNHSVNDNNLVLDRVYTRGLKVNKKEIASFSSSDHRCLELELNFENPKPTPQ